MKNLGFTQILSLTRKRRHGGCEVDKRRRTFRSTPKGAEIKPRTKSVSSVQSVYKKKESVVIRGYL